MITSKSLYFIGFSLVETSLTLVRIALDAGGFFETEEISQNIEDFIVEEEEKSLFVVTRNGNFSNLKTGESLHVDKTAPLLCWTSMNMISNNRVCLAGWSQNLKYSCVLVLLHSPQTNKWSIESSTKLYVGRVV